MLGKQRNKQANDPQFMETAWENMAEILDREMPVEQKSRRITWLPIAALIVLGFVGGISVMWGLQKHQSVPMAINQAKELPHQSRTTNTDSDATYSVNEKDPVSTTNNSIAYNSTTTSNQKTTTSNGRETRTQHPLNTANTIPAVVAADQNALLQNSGSIMTSPRIAMAVNVPEKVISDVELIAETATPLFALPAPDLADLTTDPSSFTIDNDLDLPKDKKWRTGVYAGAVIAGKTGNGLETAFRAERKLGAKWAVETGLGLRATQLAFLNKNENLDDFVFEDGFQSVVNPDSALSYAEREVIANTVNADAPDYHLTVPLSIVFRPTGKLRLAMGMSLAYRLNTLKDAATIFDSSELTNEFLTDVQDKNSFSERFNNFRMSLGVGYQLNDRMGIELGYSRQLNLENNRFSDNRAAGLFTPSDDTAIPGNFFRLGWIYYFR